MGAAPKSEANMQKAPWRPPVVEFETNYQRLTGFPGGSDRKKNPPADAGDLGSIPGPGRSPGEGNGNPLQYSFLENSMDKGAWHATVHGVTKSWKQLSD